MVVVVLVDALYISINSAENSARARAKSRIGQKLVYMYHNVSGARLVVLER